MADLVTRLQTTLGAGYRVEKELGGGGMSRVFLAEEVRLGRRVVVKVLPPEMSAGVSVDRFEREIQLAARLQHPHIVPLLTAGSSDDVLYYIMPFIEGESLRAKLAREGELPVPEALQILRDVLDALAYAHRHQVVHRDIKPDNVLLSEGHALVTDFGVAKAVAESTGKQTLTSMGVALGTPAYMAPEQATADPHTDHRADLYALGALAYEMLSGRPPFMAMNAQAMLAAHVTEAPEPVTKHRATVPPALNELILRCLAKKPADRWQRAEELIPQVAGMLTPTGGTTPTGTQPTISSGTAAAIERAHPVRVAALFGLASVGVLAIVYAAVQLIGLPDWVFYGAIALLGIGLPIMVVTGHHERRRALARSSGRMQATPSGGLTPHFTWRKALVGGGIAFAGLGVLSTGYMTMRALGIGPLGTLVASGALSEREPLLLTAFSGAASDSAVTESVTELMRIGLAQSRVVAVLEPRQVGDVLERMRRDRNERITPDLAAEIAAREGIKAYVAGEVRSVGESYLVSVRIVEAGSGAALVSLAETARTAADVIGTVDRLTKGLRERAGESLRTLRAEPPLDRITTTSLGALRLYAQANRFADQGDYDRAITLFEQAVALDSTFAMAYRRLGAYYGNRGSLREREQAVRRAYALRDRLSELERHHVEAGHAMWVVDDDERAVTSYLAILQKYPTDAVSLNNIATLYNVLGRPAERDASIRRGIEAGVATAISYGTFMVYLRWAGNLPAADSILALQAERFPDNRQRPQYASNLALDRQQFGEAEARARELLQASPSLQQWAHDRLAYVAAIRGKLRVSQREGREARRIQAERLGWSAERREITVELQAVQQRLTYGLVSQTAAADALDRLWRRELAGRAGRTDDLPPYGAYIGAFAQAARPARGRQLLDEWRAKLSDRERAQRFTRYGLQVAEANVLLGEARYQEAAALFVAACEPFRGEFAFCAASAEVANAYDRAGQPDSALAHYERYAVLQADRVGLDATWFAHAHRRAGELHEARGNREKALEYYGKFVDLWQDADPELQPLVQEARQRMARLTAEAASR